MRKNTFFGAILALITMSVSLSSCSSSPSSGQANGASGPNARNINPQVSVTSQNTQSFKTARNINTTTKAS